MKYLLILILLLTGCSGQPRQSIIGHRGDIYVYDKDDKQVSHVRVVMNKPMTFSVSKDGTITADSRTESVFTELIRLKTLEVIGKN